MQQAEEALERGETKKRKQSGRVLADAPQDEEAQKLLERLELQGRQPRWHLWLLTLVPFFLVAVPTGCIFTASKKRLKSNQTQQYSRRQHQLLERHP